MKLKRKAPIYVIFVTFLCIFVLTKSASDYTINLTKSLPRGIYKLYPATNLQIGDIVIFNVPEKTKKYLYGRHYVPKLVTTIMKHISATEKDKINIINNEIFINNVSWGKITKMDSKGRRLPELSKNDLIPKHGEFLPLAKTKNSFDGRYFGTIKLNKIKNKAKLVFAF